LLFVIVLTKKSNLFVNFLRQTNGKKSKAVKKTVRRQNTQHQENQQVYEDTDSLVDYWLAISNGIMIAIIYFWQAYIEYKYKSSMYSKIFQQHNN